MLLNCGVGEDSKESLGLQGDPTSQSYKISPRSINVEWVGFSDFIANKRTGHIKEEVEVGYQGLNPAPLP